MDLTTFLQQRRGEWRQLENLLERVEGSGLGSLDDDQAVAFGQLYRRAASDLNQAQTFVRGEQTVHYLNDLVARCYLVIYARNRVRPWDLIVHLFWTWPAVFRRYLPHFLTATLIFFAGSAIGFLASYFDPSSRVFLLPANMPTITPDEATGHLQTSGELAAFSSHLFTNNVQVSLLVFAVGITFGVGSAWLLFYNGLLMGALGAVFVEAKALLPFATGILPHGVLEIPAALLGGAAGFVIAEAMIRARPWPRIEEMARAGSEALLLVSGCVPLLAFAAILEAGVARAPDTFLGSGLKLAVAGVFGLLFLIYVLLLGWGAKPKAEGSV